MTSAGSAANSSAADDSPPGPDEPAPPAAGPRYAPRFHVVLYQPEIPYNTGSVGRTCLALGAKLWLVRPLGFRVDDYYLRRAGLDYWELLDWEAVDSWTDLLQRLPRERHWYFSARGSRSYWQAEFQPEDVLVFGPESQGLPAELTQECPQRVLRIPIVRPEVRSLNLSNSVALASYEACRQWGLADDPGSAG